VELSDERSFSELIGRRVEDQSGRSLGRLFEVRGHWQGGEVVLDELMVGRQALWRRLRGPGEEERGIPWANVIEIDDERIVVHR
jgi:sporulation protein YlmC with PRC-barrel domain